MDESDGQTALFLKLHTDTFDVSSCPVGMVSPLTAEPWAPAGRDRTGRTWGRPWALST